VPVAITLGVSDHDGLVDEKATELMLFTVRPIDELSVSKVPEVVWRNSSLEFVTG
jgi:hypothetical protein